MLKWFVTYILILWCICGSVGCKSVKHPSEVPSSGWNERDEAPTFIGRLRDALWHDLLHND